MLHVVLDTSIYTGNAKRDSSPFRALVRLAQAGVVQIHIPEVVRREFTGQQREKIEVPLKEMIATLKKLRRTNGGDEFGTFANDTINAARVKAAGAKDASEAEFGRWLNSVKAIDHRISLEEAQGALDGYFSGEPPYKSIKNRQDIPDAFIWLAISNLAKQHESLHFVVADNTLRAAADACENIFTYPTLDEFIQDPECQDALTEISANENRSANRERLLGRLPKIEKGLSEQLESLMVGVLDGKDVQHPSIPDDNNEGMVIGVGEVSDVTFNFDSTEYYGEDDIGIPFDALAECTLNYAIFKADYYSLDEDKMDRMSIDERNRHYYDVDEDYSLRVSGVLTLKIDGDMLEDELDDSELDDVILQSDSDIDIQEIAVE